MGFARITDSNRRWWVLATMAGSLSMIMIDQTVVSVALPTVERDLGLSQVAAQWVVNAYMLTLAMFVAIGGRLGDLFGPERLFRAGVALFVAASALCGLAQGEAWIIGARALQGVGAAVMVPATGAILINAFGPDERGKAMGIYSGSSEVVAKRCVDRQSIALGGRIAHGLLGREGLGGGRFTVASGPSRTAGAPRPLGDPRRAVQNVESFASGTAHARISTVGVLMRSRTAPAADAPTLSMRGITGVSVTGPTAG